MLLVIKKLFLVFVLFPVVAFASVDIEPFEMKNVPVSEFIQWYSKVTNNNVVIGSGVEGRVSAYGNRLNFSDVDQFFTLVMHSHGYDVSRESGVVAVNKGLKPVFDPDSVGFVVYNFKNIDAVKAVSSLRNALSASVPDAFVINQGSSVQASQGSQYTAKNFIEILPASNGVIVVADVDRLEFVRSLMPQIDTRQKQILIEAVILETDITDSQTIDFDLSSALSSNGFSFISKTAGVLTSDLDLDDLSNGGHLVVSSGGDIRGLVSALSAYDNNKILSTPKLLVMDRERGYITVGQNVPFLVGTETTSGGTTIQRIERKDVGLSLTVTPVIIGNSVKLRINQSSSSVTASTQAKDIITNQRTIETVASVLSGESIVLGGMIADEQVLSESGVPILKDIPFLGRLFTSDSTRTVKRELSVIIKTAII